MSIAPFSDFPEARSAKPLWLLTLADLALLLVGFLVFLQATTLDKRALAGGLRAGFGVVTPDAPMPVAAGLQAGFAPGSATSTDPVAALAAWAEDAARDPRVKLNIAGSVDGTTADVDAATGSGAVLASDRARGVAAALVEAGAIAPDRIILSTAQRAGPRRVLVTVAFTGETK